MNILEKIITETLTDDQYYKIETKKDFVVIHHTVSPGNDAGGDIRWWLSSPERVATHCIITQDGTIHQTINSKYWGHHLGIKSDQFKKFGLKEKNTDLNQRSYSIEFDSLGPVDKNGNSIAYPKLKAKNFIHYPGKYRGFEYFETYTPQQIESAFYLIKLIAEKNNIDLKYNVDMWDISKKALGGAVTGVWTHTSFREDKSDCHPQKELIEMLKSF